VARCSWTRGPASRCVLIRLSSADIDFEKINADGSDLRFVNGGPNPLSQRYELESFDADAGTAVAWARMPGLQSNQGAVVGFLYYGNPSATAPTGGGPVWPDYDAVWHLDEGDPQDSSPGGHHAVSDGSSDAPGIVGSGRGFDCDAGSKVSFGNVLNPGAGDYAISVWTHADSATPTYGAIVTKHWEDAFAITRSADASGARFYWHTTELVGAYYATGLDGVSTIFDSSWHHVTAVRRGGAIEVWVDGNLEAEDLDEPLSEVSTALPLLLGMDPTTPEECLIGYLDEVRIQTGGDVPSAGEIKARYDEVVGELITLGAESNAP
jgi:hypothetical protein